ncbi:MAG: caspase family protein [Elusimicrobiota bacterium]
MKNAFSIVMAAIICVFGLVQPSYAVRAYFKDYQPNKYILPNWFHSMSNANDADWAIEVKINTLSTTSARSMNATGHFRVWTIGWIALALPLWYWFLSDGYKGVYNFQVLNLNNGNIQRFKRTTVYGEEENEVGIWKDSYKLKMPVEKYILKYFMDKDTQSPTLKLHSSLNDQHMLIRGRMVQQSPRLEKYKSWDKYSTKEDNIRFSYIVNDNIEIERVRIMKNNILVYNGEFTYQTEARDNVKINLELDDNIIEIKAYDWVGNGIEYIMNVNRITPDLNLVYKDVITKNTGKEIVSNNETNNSVVQMIPRLEYEVSFYPEKDNNKFEGGKNVGIKVFVSNTGHGSAQLVRVRLSGDNDLINYVGQMREIEEIKPSETKEVSFETTLPNEIPRKEAKINISVKEGRGYSPSKVIEKRIVMIPKEVELVEALPGLEPVPETYKRGDNSAYAIVIGISDYPSINKLKYARKDAELMEEYINCTMGVPKNNIKVLKDTEATGTRIKATINSWLRGKNPKSIIFYYAGHGIFDTEDPTSQQPYLIPHDGDMDLGKTTMISLNEEVVPWLQQTGATKIILLLDSCFSGRGGRTPQLLAQRGVAIEPKFKQTNCMILSATSGKLPSYEYDKSGHGYFTYYLCRGIKDGDADKNKDSWVDVNEAYEYIKEKLWQDLGDKQIPTISESNSVDKFRFAKTR